MPVINEFRQRRLENIKRNNELLRKLNLSGLSTQIKKEVGDEDKAKSKQHTNKKVRKKKSPEPEHKSAPVPTRRSRRLMGEKADDEGIPNINDNELIKFAASDKKVHESNELKELRDTRVVGDIKLSDLVKAEDEDELLDKFRKFADNNFSSGDLFHELRNYRKLPQKVKDLQKVFSLTHYETFDPKELSIGYERISAMFFHPSHEKKLIIGGDIGGTIGLWNVVNERPSSEDELVEPDITRFKLFSKNVSKIESFPNDSGKLLAASYDGSLRSIHLNNLKSIELMVLKNDYDDYLGISDCQFSCDNENVLFLTTLEGHFAQVDLRMKPEKLDLVRLSDKKIGSMAINPRNHYEIATGSLDRTLKLWDLRKTVANPDWSQLDDYASHEVVSTYESPLSVSAVSFSPLGDSLVCNGYDNTIRLFEMNQDINESLDPHLTIKHNCKSGRWCSILKARFKSNQDIFSIANMKRAIDIYTSSGEQLAHLPTSTVPAVLSWHPTQNWIVGGNASGKVYLFTDENKD